MVIVSNSLLEDLAFGKKPVEIILILRGVDQVARIYTLGSCNRCHSPLAVEQGVRELSGNRVLVGIERINHGPALMFEVTDKVADEKRGQVVLVKQQNVLRAAAQSLARIAS